MRNVFWMILVCTYFFLAGCGGGGGDGGGGGVSELPNSPSPGTPAQNPVIPFQSVSLTPVDDSRIDKRESVCVELASAGYFKLTINNQLIVDQYFLHANNQRIKLPYSYCHSLTTYFNSNNPRVVVQVDSRNETNTATATQIAVLHYSEVSRGLAGVSSPIGQPELFSAKLGMWFGSSVAVDSLAVSDALVQRLAGK
ncbi:MAG: hypothetical protein H3C47_10140 [Candidatus Cloacimonetes bacterium]|nr:hypothetical protein [Candidatus Cloacimonadota bacterium]